MAKDRFKKVYSQGVMQFVEIWVDQETGVNYLYRSDSHSGGRTVLLGSDGKPVISPVENH